MRRTPLALLGLVALLAAVAPALAAPPIPETNFAGTVLPAKPCAAKAANPYEAALYAAEGWKGPNFVRYPGACERLKFVFGPVLIKPGQNDVMLQPLTIEKPAYDGSMVRFDVDLVDEKGAVPPIELVHLHHAVWITEPEYGTGPFAASGEEKTIDGWPRGYGLPVKGSDPWAILYMIHSGVPTPMSVFITYDVDYIPAGKAQSLGLKPAYPIWLDVGKITPRTAYPVFNVQRGFGTNGECTWPKQTCASIDPYGGTFVGQGEPGNGEGVDWRLPARGGSIGRIRNFTGGTLINIAGHLHPGGLRNEIDLLRGGKQARIYTGDAVYWDRKDPTKPGGPPTSWDFSMPSLGLPAWGVRVEPGDVIRSNVTYESAIQATYEGMGIAVALLAPDEEGKPTAPGIDAFRAPKDRSVGCRSGGVSAGRLCDRGTPTHPHLPEAANFGGPRGELLAKRGAAATRVNIAAFSYSPGDLGTAPQNGIPTVNLGQKLQFVNEDFPAAGVLHSVTSCAYPCMGTTGTAFPLANGRSSRGRRIEFDSATLGYGTPVGSAKNALDWSLDVSPANGFGRGETYTYFCRIHPFMRGAFEVV